MKLLKLAICFAIATPCVAAAETQGCKEVALKLSGSLAESDQTVTVRVPVESIAASDVSSTLRLNRKTENAWELTLVDTPDGDPYLSLGSIVFDSYGLVESSPSFGFQPKSSNPIIAQSGIVITFEDLVAGPKGTALTLTPVASVDARCRYQGQLDTTNEVNGGADVKYLYGIKNVAEGTNWEPPARASSNP